VSEDEEEEEGEEEEMAIGRSSTVPLRPPGQGWGREEQGRENRAVAGGPGAGGRGAKGGANGEQVGSTGGGGSDRAFKVDARKVSWDKFAEEAERGRERGGG